jgi:hypothetical protein
MLKTKILIQESSMNVMKEHIAALEIQVKGANVMFADQSPVDTGGIISSVYTGLF